MRTSLLSAAFVAALALTAASPTRSDAQVVVSPGVVVSPYTSYYPSYWYGYQYASPYSNGWTYSWSNPYNWGSYYWTGMPSYSAYYTTPYYGFRAPYRLWWGRWRW